MEIFKYFQVMVRKNIPFDFVFDYLMALKVTVKPMFGVFTIYVNKRMVMALRQREDHRETNGVWVAAEHEHLNSLKKELPSLQAISFFTKDNKETAWQVIPVDSGDFEETVRKVCELIVQGDPRIGKMPKPRKRKNKLE